MLIFVTIIHSSYYFSLFQLLNSLNLNLQVLPFFWFSSPSHWGQGGKEVSEQLHGTYYQLGLNHDRSKQLQLTIAEVKNYHLINIYWRLMNLWVKESWLNLSNNREELQKKFLHVFGEFFFQLIKDKKVLLKTPVHHKLLCLCFILHLADPIQSPCKCTQCLGSLVI